MNRRRSYCEKGANLYEMRPIFFSGGGAPARSMAPSITRLSGGEQHEDPAGSANHSP